LAKVGSGSGSGWAAVSGRCGPSTPAAPGGTDAALDRVLSFFETIHHFKDWLRNDPKSGVTKTDVHAVIDSSLALQLCADLANGSKHLKLTNSQTGDLGTTIARNDVSVFVGTGTSAHRFYIASRGADHDVLEIAEQAVEAWTIFLSRRNFI